MSLLEVCLQLLFREGDLSSALPVFDDCLYMHISIYTVSHISMCMTQGCEGGCSQGLPGVPGIVGAKGEKGDQGKPGVTPLDSCDKVRLGDMGIYAIYSESYKTT